MTTKTLFKIAKYSAFSVAALLLLGIVVFWGIRVTVWHGNVHEFYTLPLDDGPYVFRDAGTMRIVHYDFVPPENPYAWSRVLRAAWSQELDGEYRTREQSFDLSNEEEVHAAIATDPILDYDPYSAPKVDEVAYAAPRVAAVSDIHGSVFHLKTLLKAAGIVDEDLNWTWDDGHLVVNGDTVDKAPGVIESLWLLRKLEHQAAAAGGGVHVLLGNHEVMLLTASNTLSDKLYRGRKYRTLARELGVSYGDLFGPHSDLGNWLGTRNTVVQINDVLFVHGGFSRYLLEHDLSLEKINQWGRELVQAGYRLPPGATGTTLTDATTLPDLLVGYWGPYEYKGYFDTEGYREEFDESVIDEALERYQASHIVVGHHSVRSVHTVRDGRVVAIGVRMPSTDIPADPQVGEMLLIEDGAFYRILSDGTRLPL